MRIKGAFIVCLILLLSFASCRNNIYIAYDGYFKQDDGKVYFLKEAYADSSSPNFEYEVMFKMDNNSKTIKDSYGLNDLTFPDSSRLYFYTLGMLQNDTFNMAKRYSSNLNLFVNILDKKPNEFLPSVSGENDSVFTKLKEKKIDFYSQMVEISEKKYIYKNICQKRYFFSCHVCDTTKSAYVMCFYDINFIDYKFSHFLRLNKYISSKKKIDDDYRLILKRIWKNEWNLLGKKFNQINRELKIVPEDYNILFYI